MLEKIIDYLKKREWSYTLSKISGVLFFPVKGVNGTFNCAVEVSNNDFFFLFISFNGTNCPPEHRQRFSELLNRINFNLKFGNFELGMESGEIKFRTSLYYEEMEINDKIIENIIIRNIHIHDFAFPYFSKFLFGSIPMEEVYARIFPSANPKEIEDKKASNGNLENNNN